MFVKICGTTTEEDALLSVAMGADAVGFIFAPSPRQVSPGHVADIVKRLPREVLTVGVFRDEAPQRVVEIINTVGLRAAQLHGHETPEQAQFVRERVPLLIQAFPAGDPALGRIVDYRADAVLLDAATPGSGEVFDWSMAEVPVGIRLILAGGLTPANVANAIAQVHPWGVDVATGVEASPGVKDPRKVRAFVAAVRAAAPMHDRDEDDAEDGDDPYDWDFGGT
jgi:phosphoribosylanthranilate isomerase